MLLVIFVLNKSEEIQQHNTEDSIEKLYKSKASGVLVSFDATVENILSDDIEGSKHQRLILKTNNKYTPPD